MDSCCFCCIVVAFSAIGYPFEVGYIGVGVFRGCLQAVVLVFAGVLQLVVGETGWEFALYGVEGIGMFESGGVGAEDGCAYEFVGEVFHLLFSGVFTGEEMGDAGSVVVDGEGVGCGGIGGGGQVEGDAEGFIALGCIEDGDIEDAGEGVLEGYAFCFGVDYSPCGWFYSAIGTEGGEIGQVVFGVYGVEGDCYFTDFNIV